MDASDGATISTRLQLFRDVVLPETEIKLQIGPVPIFMSFLLDVALGLDGSLTLAPGSSLAAKVGMTGCAEYGLELSELSGSIEPVDRVVFEQSATLERGGASAADAVLGAYVAARVYIKLQRIGGPVVLVEPSIELALQAAVAEREACTSLNWGVDVGIGG